MSQQVEIIIKKIKNYFFPQRGNRNKISICSGTGLKVKFTRDEQDKEEFMVNWPQGAFFETGARSNWTGSIFYFGVILAIGYIPKTVDVLFSFFFFFAVLSEGRLGKINRLTRNRQGCRWMNNFLELHIHGGGGLNG